MNERRAIHITRNPWGYSPQEQRRAHLRLADLVEGYRDAYHNMKAFAEAHGLDTTTRNGSREDGERK